jgi:hypothetical protein
MAVCSNFSRTPELCRGPKAAAHGEYFSLLTIKKEQISSLFLLIILYYNI